jgi:hypothetical protein
VRALALLGASSAAIHQLRYAIASGSAHPHGLGVHGHDYLTVALPVVVGLALLALASAITRLARGGRGAAAGASFAALWLAAALALASIYAVQETIEGAGAVAGSGWIGIALAVPAGMLIALALRGAEAAEGLALQLPAAFRIFADALIRMPSTPSRGRLFFADAGARAPPLASFI